MTIRKDPRTGRFFFRTWVRFPDGRRARVFGTPGVPGPYHDLPNTQRGAQEAERRAISKALTGQDVRPVAATAIPTVREYVTQFMDGHSAADKSSSRTDKAHRLEAYILDVVGDLRLDQVRQEHVDRIVAAMLAKPRPGGKVGLSRKTINNTTSVLSSLIGYAVKNKVIADPGLTYQIKEQDTEMIALPLEHVDRLLGATEDPRYQVAIMLAADAGLRIGEIRALEWIDVNELAREITIAWSYDREGARSETKGWERRSVPASERLWTALRSLERRGPLVFARLDGAPIGYDAVATEMRAIYEASGVPRIGGQLWHALRHTFGTELAAGGAEIQTIRELMGHKSIETTMRYLHSSRDRKRAAVKSLGSQRAAASKTEAK